MPSGSEIASLYVTVGADTDRFERGMRGVQSTAQGVGSTLRNLAVAAGAALGGQAIINSALGFDRSMANIRAVTGKTAEETAALGQELLRLGSASTAGPQAVTDAFYDIVGGVADASAHMAILNTAIAVSEAGQADLTATTSGLISVMNAYGMGADKATFAGDVLTRTVAVGVGTMDEFIAAISPVAPTMAAAGIEFEDFANMTAYMTTKGVRASMATTQLRQATVALLNPNKAMAEGLRRIGFASGAAAIKAVGLDEVYYMLQDSVGGNIDAMSEMTGSVEALNAAMIIGAPTFEEATTSFYRGIEGATAAARAIQLDSVSAQFDRLKSNLEGLAISVGAALLPALGTIVQFGVDALNAIITKGPEIVAAIGAWFSSTEIGQSLQAAWAAIQPQIQGLAGNITSALNALFQPGGSGVEFNGPRELFEQTMAGINNMPAGPGQDLARKLAPSVSAGTRFQWFFEDIKTAILEGVPNVLNTLSTEIGRIGTQVINSLTTFVDGLEIPQPIKDVIDLVLAPLKDAFARLSEINWNNIVIAAGVIGAFAAGVKGLGLAFAMIKDFIVFDMLIRGLESLDRLVQGFKNQDAKAVLEGIAGAILFLGVALVTANAGPLLAGVAAGLTGIQTVAVAGGPLVTGLYAVGTAIGALLGPIALVTVAVGGLTLALMALMRTRDEAANSLRNFKDEFSDPAYLRLLNEGQAFQGAPQTITNPMATTSQPELGITNPFPTVIPPGQAFGGPVMGRRPYLVGERGPELFVPPTGGRILPNDRLGGGGAPVVVPVTLTLDGKVVAEAVVRQDRITNGRMWGR